MKDQERYEDLIGKSTFKDIISLISNEDAVFKIQNSSNQTILETIDFIRKNLSDEKILIEDEITFNGRVFDFEIDLSNCIFKNKVIFRKCTFKEKVDIRDSKFKNITSFKGSVFISKVRFHWSIFNKSVDFQNTVFKDLADFYCAKFKDEQQFFLTDFLGISIFSHVIFSKQIQFLYNKVSSESIISFESAKFEQSLDISRANFWCKLHFWNSEINNKPNELSLYQTDKIHSNNTNNDIALKQVRESFRIIKHNFRKEGNNIDALFYHKNEMIMYRNEVKSNKKSTIEDLITLYFNWHSNKFGTSWSRALCFTLSISLIFYFIFLLTLSSKLELECSWNCLGEIIKYWLQFLNVTIWKYKPFGLEDYSWGYGILFIGRIFIGYGYYQIIQAFRKYGKN